MQKALSIIGLFFFTSVALSQSVNSWDEEKIEVKKFDPVVRKHVMYKEAKIK